MTLRRLVAFALALVALLLVVRPAHAHKPSDAYLTLEVDGARIAGRWDVALRDLDYAIGLDDGDAKITWGELQRSAAPITRYAGERLALRDEAGAPCPTRFEPAPAGVVTHSDGTYAVLRFTAVCPSAPRSLGVDYRLFFDVDPQHRGLLHVEAAGATRTATFSASATATEIALAGGSRLGSFRRMVVEGMLHIWHGYDHVLFLFALLLPSVLRRERDGWKPVEGLRPALGDVLRIVTAFTVSHSITLSLAALGVVTLPSRLVESAIAASVVLAAVNNVVPVLRQDRWAAAFLLGLMHGFGFSATLADLDLPRTDLVATLFGFNLGVELGQLAIVLAFVPLAYAARRTFAYRRVALVGGSVAIGAVAVVWLVERAFELRLVS